MAKGDTAAEAPTTQAAPEEVIEQWFRETFYNRALDTEFFNYVQEAKADLIARFKGGA